MKTKILIPLAGLALFCACKGVNTSKSADTASVEPHKNQSHISKTDLTQNSPKLVKTANIRFKVKNVQQTSERIAALAASLNGSVIHQLVNSTRGNSVDIKKSNDSLIRITVLNTTAEMTVKVPPENMGNFLTQVSRLCIYLENSNMDITDKSLDYLSTKLKLKNQSESISQEKKDDTNSVNSLLAFKNNMIDQEIGNRKIVDSTKNGIVTLSFYENNIINRETIANDDLSAYNPPFFKRLDISIENGWEVCMDILTALANFWMFIPIGIGTWIIVRYHKRKKLVDLIKN